MLQNTWLSLHLSNPQQERIFIKGHSPLLHVTYSIEHVWCFCLEIMCSNNIISKIKCIGMRADINKKIILETTNHPLCFSQLLSVATNKPLIFVWYKPSELAFSWNTFCCVDYLQVHVPVFSFLWDIFVGRIHLKLLNRIWTASHTNDISGNFIIRIHV